MSHVMCHMKDPKKVDYYFFFFLILDISVELVGGGSAINGAYIKIQ